MAHGVLHQPVPVVAGLHHHGDSAAGILRVDRKALRGDPDHGAGEPVVGDQEVGASADDQELLPRRVRRPDGVDDLFFRPGLDERAGGAADGGRGQLGKKGGSHPSTILGNPPGAPAARTPHRSYRIDN